MCRDGSSTRPTRAKLGSCKIKSRSNPLKPLATPYNRAHHRFAVFTACATFVLILAGALVTSNDAGLSIPDWPTSLGAFRAPPFAAVAPHFFCLAVATAMFTGRRWVEEVPQIEFDGRRPRLTTLTLLAI